MTHFKDLPTTRSRAVLALAALAAVALVAGCGSSGSSSSIGVGQENSTLNAKAKGSEAPTVTTPTSGPLSTKPTVTPPSGPPPSKLVIKDLVPGTGAEAKARDMVAVNYVGVLYHGGKEFDSSWSRKEPFTFTLGEGHVIPGWDQGVVGMKVGGRRELIIPASLAYGAKGAPPTIPPNAPLVFVIDLLSV